MSNDKKKIKILIVDDIPEARESLKKLLSFEPDFDVVGTASTGREGIDQAREHMPHIVLMDINMPDMDGITATGELRRTNPSVGVVMMSVQGEAEYLRRAMAAGARDFLTKPTPTEELYATVRRVFEDIQQFQPMVSTGTGKSGSNKLEVDPDRESHIVVVYSPQGGAGKTTVATNVATALMIQGARVLLIDADMQFGDVGVFLNLKPQTTIVDLIKSVDELDEDLVNNILVTHESGLRVLLAPVRPEEADLVPHDKVPVLAEKLKTMFDVIVVDTSSVLDNMTLGLFDKAARVLMVINPTLPCVKNALSVMQLMDSFEYPEEKTQLVINRVTPDLERAKVTIAIAAIEAKLKRKSLGIIPMDERRVLYAVNRGISLVAKDRTQSPAKELIALSEALWANLHPEPEAPAPVAQQRGQKQQPPQPRSRLGRLFEG